MSKVAENASKDTTEPLQVAKIKMSLVERKLERDRQIEPDQSLLSNLSKFTFAPIGSERNFATRLLDGTVVSYYDSPSVVHDTHFVF